MSASLGRSTPFILLQIYTSPEQSTPSQLLTPPHRYGVPVNLLTVATKSCADVFGIGLPDGTFIVSFVSIHPVIPPGRATS